jgi:hypothetical protein
LGRSVRNLGRPFPRSGHGADQQQLDACLSHPAIRNIISQPGNAIDIRKIMDERRILIVNLSKGSVGELPCRLFGALLVSAITSAAFSRSDVAEDQREPFDLVLDEFSSVITTDITTILSEARKYRLQLTLASQYLSQIPDDILAGVFGNAGTYMPGLIAFLVGNALDLVEPGNCVPDVGRVVDGLLALPGKGELGVGQAVLLCGGQALRCPRDVLSVRPLFLDLTSNFDIAPRRFFLLVC